MTPKEKAQELIGKCFDVFINDKDEHYAKTAWRLSKQCALTAVDEILDIAYWEYMDSGGGQEKEYLLQVKKEIENL